MKKWGKLGTFKVIPLKDVNVRFDICYEDSVISNYDFVTGDEGKFTLEIEDFYGKKYASLTPTLTGKQIQDTIFKFSLDKYFSPKFRLFDYWQRNTGSSIEKERTERDKSIVQLDGENRLDMVDVTAKKYKGRATRPPKSEIHLDFMEEWEYAQDVSYLITPNDNWISYKVNDISDILERAGSDEAAWNIMKYVFDAEINYRSDDYYHEASSPSTGTWRADYWEGPRHYAYKDVLTAFDVLQSAFWRYNYNWAYWIKLMVVKGEYKSNVTPIEDSEYLKGKDPVAMMNFKEFVIRNDQNTLKKFVNSSDENVASNGKGSNSRGNISRSSYLRKGMYRSFYYGFLLRSSIYPQDDKQIDGYPGHILFRNQMARRVSGIGIYKQYKDYEISQKMYPEHPNYVACFIPNKEEDKVTQGIIPELAVKTTRRYTRVQGYNESKRFYSPDYSKNRPDENTKDYRRTLLWIPDAEVGNDGCITVELHNNSKESILQLDIIGIKNDNYFIKN